MLTSMLGIYALPKGVCAKIFLGVFIYLLMCLGHLLNVLGVSVVLRVG